MTQDVDVLRLALKDLELTAPSIFTGTILLGVYTLLYICSTFILLRRGLRNLPYAIMLLVTSATFASSITYWAICVSAFLRSVYSPSSDTLATVSFMSWESFLLTFCIAFNIVMSDSIVLWRTWALSKGSIVIRGFGAILLLATVVFIIVDFVMRPRLPPIPSVKPVPSTFNNIFGTIAVFLSLVTNIWATAIVAVKAWRLRVFMKRNGNLAQFPTWKILYLLVECGALYCIIWTFFFATIFSPEGYTSLVYVSNQVMAQVTGMYPTLIIDMVCLRQTLIKDSFMLELESSIRVDPVNEPSSIDPIQIVLSPQKELLKDFAGDADADALRSALTRAGHSILASQRA